MVFKNLIIFVVQWRWSRKKSERFFLQNSGCSEHRVLKEQGTSNDF